MEPEKRKSSQPLIYQIGGKRGTIRPSRENERDGDPFEDAAQPEVPGFWMKLWHPAPMPSSRVLYAAFWALPVVCFAAAWAAAYFLMR